MTISMTMTLALQSAVRKGSGWLGQARTRIAADPTAIRSLLPAAGRHCGRDAPLTANGWRSDDAARVLLLTALPLHGPALVREVSELYRYGDADEKRAVLRALPWLEVGDGCVELLRDALRTNDTRLVAAALGPYAENLDDAAWRQGVLKCVFMQVPLSVVDDLPRRADSELAVMLTALLQERVAAGRTIPDDAMALLHGLTPEKVA
jgi:hypothetical protein